MMIGFFAAAIANVRGPEIHNRWMYVLMVSVLIPVAIAVPQRPDEIQNS